MATPAKSDTLPVVKSKRRRIQVVAMLHEFGREWRLVRPNAIVANKVFSTDDEGNPSVDPGALTDYFRSHVHPEERDEFIKCAREDATLGLPDLTELMRRMSDAVYEGLEDDEDDDAIDVTATEKS